MTKHSVSCTCYCKRAKMSKINSDAYIIKDGRAFIDIDVLIYAQHVTLQRLMKLTDNQDIIFGFGASKECTLELRTRIRSENIEQFIG